MNRDPELARALASLKRGQLAEAEAICRSRLERAPQDAAAMHVLALVRREAGDTEDTERLMRASIAADPQRGEYRANLAHLMRREGRLGDAERLYRESLSLDPDNRLARLGLARTLADLGELVTAESECLTLITADDKDGYAWTALGDVLARQDRLEEAESAYLRAVAARPDYAPAHQNLGALLARVGRAEEALEALARAEQRGARGLEPACNRGRALLALQRLDEAERAFMEAVAADPRSLAAQTELTRVRFMRGDEHYARDLAAAVREHGDAALTAEYAAILQRAGERDAAEKLLREALARDAGSPLLQVALADVLAEAGRLKEAEGVATDAATARPQDPSIVENLVAILLARGKAADAQPFIRGQRDRRPHDQAWLAWEATAARQTGEARHGELYDYARFVKSYLIEAPPGYGSVAEFNGALARALEPRLAANDALDPYVRNGSLTARDLVADRDPVIRAALAAMAMPLKAYREHLGDAAGHPLTERNRGTVRLASAWSVQLRRAGVHLNHVRPDGWISGVYWVCVPEEVADVGEMSGWMRFGEPRVSVPGALPECFIKPQAGLVTFYPSYMWQGTSPLRGPVPLTAIGFDVVPIGG